MACATQEMCIDKYQETNKLKHWCKEEWVKSPPHQRERPINAYGKRLLHVTAADGGYIRSDA